MVQLLAAQFGGLWLWAVVVAAAAVVLWRRGCRLRGKGLFAAGLLLERLESLNRDLGATILMVTHDRYFLERVVTRIADRQGRAV